MEKELQCTMALVSSWSTWKHGLLHVPDHKGCCLCLCFLSVLAAEGGCYFLACEFYKNITRILNLVRRGRAMKSDVIQLFCGAYLEMSHKILSENGKLYPPTNSSILNLGITSSQRWTRERSRFLHKKVQKCDYRPLWGAPSSTVAIHAWCPADGWRGTSFHPEAGVPDCWNTPLWGPCLPSTDRKGHRAGCHKPSSDSSQGKPSPQVFSSSPISPISLQLASYSKATT